MNDDFNSRKRLNGQFFTITNPFNLNVFYKQQKLIPTEEKQIIIEPFAGSNNIVQMIENLHILSKQRCFDIDPSDINKAPKYTVEQRDSIENFPKNYSVAITNPPYLAKNSATRRGIEFKYPEYDDLYKKCVEVMLANLNYVAAIIPESFITSGLFHNRLWATVSLTCKMFEDTECPVCLALFVPSNQVPKHGFILYDRDKLIGNYNDLIKAKNRLLDSKHLDYKFNNPNGTIGVRCIDNNREPSIIFVEANIIDNARIKESSRSFTKISGIPEDLDLKQIINNANEVLRQYRASTNDVFMTCFKGLRADDKYRRRLDFKTAALILDKAVAITRGESDENA